MTLNEYSIIINFHKFLELLADMKTTFDMELNLIKKGNKLYALLINNSCRQLEEEEYAGTPKTKCSIKISAQNEVLCQTVTTVF